MADVIGNDDPETLTGTTAADFISGMGGDDRLDAKTRPPGVGPIDIVDGGSGIDTLIVDASAETQAVFLSIFGNPRFSVRSDSGNFAVDANNTVEKIEITTGSGNDVIDTASFGVIVNGGGGTDRWIADLSAVTTDIVFHLGTTTSIAAAGLISILGIEQIWLTTGSGNDTITGGAQADRIAAGAGNDRIDAKTRPTGIGPIDLVDGGDGIDTLVVDASAETDSVFLSIFGNPRFSVSSNSGNFAVDGNNAMEKIEITTGSGNDVIDTASFGVIVNGGGGIDRWQADLSAVTTDIVFHLGTTTSIGAAGLTTITGIEQIWLTTGSGNDTITGGAQADRIAAGAGNDRIDAKTRPTGIGPIDLVDGGDGIDTLVVDASAETDSVFLSIFGNPRFSVSSNSGNFAVDGNNAVEKIEITTGSGNDVIDTASFGVVVNGGGGTDRWQADLSAVTTDIVFHLGTTTSIAAAGLISILGIEQIWLTTGSGNDTITGGALADAITAGAGDDRIDAKTRLAITGPIDLVDGGDGIDTLVVDASAETDSVFLNIFGNPRFSVSSNSGNFAVDGNNAVERIEITTGSGNDQINTASFGVVVNGGGGTDRWQADLSAVTSDIAFDLGSTRSIAAAGLTTILNIEQIILISGSGNDRITGGSQADAVTGGDGNDTVNLRTRPVGGGIDLFSGGNGNDTLVVDASSETQGVTVSIFGNPRFSVTSVSGNFAVDADSSVENIRVTGGSANDTLSGAGGMDRLNGGGGDDTMTGGGEGDIFAYGNGGGSDRITDYNAAQGDLINLLGLTTLHSFAELNISQVTEPGFAGTLINFGGGNQLRLTGVTASTLGPANFWFSPVPQSLTITVLTPNGQFAEGDDPIAQMGAGAIDTAANSATSFTIVNAAQNREFVFDGAGFAFAAGGTLVIGGTFSTIHIRTRDTHTPLVDLGVLNISAAAFQTAAIALAAGDSSDFDLLFATLPNHFIGNSGPDRFGGKSALAEFLEGGGGNDILLSGIGADAIDGGGGSDTLDYSLSNAGVIVTLEGVGALGGYATGDTFDEIENVTGSSFADLIIGDGNPNTLSGTGGNDTLAGLAGPDTLSGGDGVDYLVGGAGNDILYGGAEGDALHGLEDNDTIDGGDGDDVLLGQGGADDLDGGAGHDTLIGDDGTDQTTFGNDTLRGGVGNDQLFGYSGNDDLGGEDGSDFLSGGDGNDTLAGGAGGDALFGDGGNDTADGGAGNDVLVGHAGSDTLNGGDDNDTLIGNEGGDTLNGGAGNDQGFGYEDADIGNGGAGDDFMAGGAGNDTLNGDDGGDVLDGEADDDTLNGGDGGDNLNGNAGNDTLAGGAGNDGLLGHNGNDILNGGPGNDFLIGDISGGDGTAGNDIFVFENGTGNDNIADLNAGVGAGDVIDIRAFGFASFAAVLNAATDLPGGIYLQLDADDAIFIEGRAKAQLAADDFLLA